MHQNTFDEKSKLLWLGAIMQQAIAWTNDDPALCRQMAWLGHYELTWWTNSIYRYHRQTVLHCAVLMNIFTLQWRQNERGSVSNHQRLPCLLNYRFRRRSKKTSKLRVTGLCAGNSPVTAEFPTQYASNAENVSIWWRHHAKFRCLFCQLGYLYPRVYSIRYRW